MTDMEEMRKLLGVSGCVGFLIKDGDMDNFGVEASPRVVANMRAAVRQANQVSKEPHKNAPITRALAILKAQRLSRFHLHASCPFLSLPLADIICFAMDRLHGMYVEPSCIAAPLWACQSLAAAQHCPRAVEEPSTVRLSSNYPQSCAETSGTFHCSFNSSGPSSSTVRLAKRKGNGNSMHSLCEWSS